MNKTIMNKTIQNIRSKIEVVASKIIVILKKIKSQYPITALIIIGVVLLYTGGKQLNYYLNSDVFYYADKDKSTEFTETQRIKKVSNESSLQASISQYLKGSYNYKGKIPFIPFTQIIDISHNAAEGIVILNWNSYFYKALESPTIEQDIKLLLKTMAKNYPVETVYFFVEGVNLNNVFWMDLNLGQGLDLKNLTLKK